MSDPRILVVPDIHERVGPLEGIRPLVKESERTIFLGDWPDSFNMKSDTRGTLLLMKEYIAMKNTEFCLGNHDCHYLFSNGMFKCSGFREKTLDLYHEMLTEDERRVFKLFHRVGNTVLSHAGYHPKYLVDGQPSVAAADYAVKMAHTGAFNALFNPGEASGGRGVGGPTWLRWPMEGAYRGIHTVDRFEPLDFPQIVGHTPGGQVREGTSDSGVTSYNIDTNLRDVVWLNADGKVVEIVNLRPQGA